MSLKEGRVTIPTNLDVVPETIELMKRWGADAIRDCDGTQFPEDLVKTGAKIYATYYTKSKPGRSTAMLCDDCFLYRSKA